VIASRRRFEHLLAEISVAVDARISRAVINVPHRRVLYGKDE